MNEVPQFASFYLLQRTGETMPGIADPAAEVVTALESLRLGPEQLRGKQIAVAAGSRGIVSLREIIRAACHWLRAQGAIPFVFPAMGSHGGATDAGQRAVLADYGVVPDFVGAEVRSSMETVRAGQTPDGFPVFIDRLAWESDGVLVINRVKPHTHFSGKIESGLLKMIAIGMGKHQGAQQYHQLAARHGFEPVVRSILATVLASGKILGGLAIVENSRHQAAAIRAAAPGELAALDEAMLVLAKALVPRLPFPSLHLLIVDEIGKNVSGTGMDAKVIGRAGDLPEPGAPRIELIYARDLTSETAGNGLGVGLADLIHERLYRKLDVEKMYVNARTSLNPWVARIPMWFRSDREALDFALRTLGGLAPADQRVAWIRNTLSLDRILVSEALAREAAGLSGWQVDAEEHDLGYDDSGDCAFRGKV
jgi:hypothetical protein